MKIGSATDSGLSHECYILQINGRTDSIYMCREDAMRACLPLKHQFPHADIKVREADSIEEVAQETVFH
jgi:hypothetical protein